MMRRIWGESESIVLSPLIDAALLFIPPNLRDTKNTRLEALLP
jgi:hypothetical protein